MMPTSSKLISEFIGTMMLVATVIGSGVMAENLAGGNVALALLGNTIATGAILFVIISAFGGVSGAHFNPVVTAVMLARREVTRSLALGYIIVQIIGGVCGTIMSHIMFELDIVQLSSNLRSGPAQYFSEIVATFGLLMTILMGVRYKSDAVPAMVALYITAAYWFTASTSFANPAVTIARTFTDTFSGIHYSDTLLFIVAQFIGAFIALIVTKKILAD